MPVDPATVDALVTRVLDDFFREEAENIALGTNERNLCGRLAIHLTNVLPGFGLERYYADTEYNRKQDGRVKTILDHRNVVVTINCDLILHLRGELVSEDNVVAFEMKKSTRPGQEKDDDRDRLRAMTKSSYDDIWSADGVAHPEHVCGYVRGVFIEVDVAAREYAVEMFSAGQPNGARNGVF